MACSVARVICTRNYDLITMGPSQGCPVNGMWRDTVVLSPNLPSVESAGNDRAQKLQDSGHCALLAPPILVHQGCQTSRQALNTLFTGTPVFLCKGHFCLGYFKFVSSESSGVHHSMGHHIILDFRWSYWLIACHFLFPYSVIAFLVGPQMMTRSFLKTDNARTPYAITELHTTEQNHTTGG